MINPSAVVKPPCQRTNSTGRPDAAHEVPFLVEDQKSDNSAFTSILIDHVDGTIVLSHREDGGTVHYGRSGEVPTTTTTNNKRAAIAASPPASRSVFTTLALAVESVPTGEDDDQRVLSPERYASDAPKRFCCSDVAFVSFQTESGTSTRTNQEAFFLGSGQRRNALAAAVDNAHGGTESLREQAFDAERFSEDEERSSIVASTDVDSDNGNKHYYSR
jgi:hypothetical protein